MHDRQQDNWYNEETESRQGNESEQEPDGFSFNRETFFEDIARSYEEFDEIAWNRGNGYQCPNFPRFNDYMEGLESGLYLFAGESNSGKSALLMNLIWDYVSCTENRLYGIYFSLDDSRNDLISRIIAMQQNIPISAAAKPWRYACICRNRQQPEESRALALGILQKREEGLKYLMDNSNRFCILDNNEITDGMQILELCARIKAKVKENDSRANIIVAIDSLSDISFESMYFRSEKELNDFIARQAKHWAVDILDCPVFGSLHLRKIEQNRRPTVADVKESGRYVYEASFLGLVHNDVSRNKQAATIFIDNIGYDNNGALIPCIELDWAKNKKSSYKGRTFYEFHPNESNVIECSNEETERLNHIFYTD